MLPPTTKIEIPCPLLPLPHLIDKLKHSIVQAVLEPTVICLNLLDTRIAGFT